MSSNFNLSSEDRLRHVIIFPSENDLFNITFFHKPADWSSLKEFASISGVSYPLDDELNRCITLFLDKGFFNYKGVFVP